MEYRIEHDSMGEVKVPADRYWAAQTQRSSQNFRIGVGIETMPREITHEMCIRDRDCSQFAKFHAKQGFNLLIFEIVLTVLCLLYTSRCV